MAGQGYVLDIDAKFLTNLQKADEALNKSVSSANALSSQFVNMVRNSGSYSQGVHNLLESLTRLGSVKIDPVTGLQSLVVESRNAKDSLDLVGQRTAGLRERWKELASEIGKTKGNDRWRMRITDEKDLTNIQALTTAVKSIDNALTKSTAKTKLTEVQRQQLVEQKAIYKSMLAELKMTDAQRIQSEIATNNKIVADATRRADAVIREKRREVNEAIQLARTSSTKAQLDSAYTALTDASRGLNPNIKSEQLMLQRLSNAQDEVIRKYFEIEKAKKKTSKDAHADAKEARALASTARSADELSRAYIEVSRAKANINPDTKRGQAEIQRLERSLEALQKRMDAVNRSTPQNALAFASYAQTPQELTQAKGYLKTAMQDVADPALMKQLNDAYNAVIAKAKELKSISSSGDAAAVKNSIDEQYRYALALSKGAQTADQLKTAIAAVQAAQANCNASTSDGMNRLNSLTAAERRLTNELAKKNGQMTIEQKETVNSAIAYAQSAQGALQLSNAYIKLRSAARNINPKTAEGQEALKRLQEELDKVDKKIRQSSSNVDKMRDRFGQIGQTVKTAFGLHAVRQFVSGLIRIHGQFEKINISLRVLLGSTARAEQLWDKITKLALKSPFTIAQLADATKQMAAYRIESNKLYQSTKMLADISAGLGVEMSRLILAYGQVKAANFLRATELRQFSEAGIDMLGQLAAYFSEVEGKAIRASEVFEMISKRKVMFEDVDEVLRRVTSSGGVFYEMQEQQAKTLSGQISNLKDSVQLMFHEIGSSTHGLIVDIVKKLKWLIDNWEKWLPHILAVASALLTVKAVGMAMAILKPLYIGIAAALNAMGVKALFAANAMRVLNSMSPWGWATMAIGSIMSVVTALTVFDGAEEMAEDASDNLGDSLTDVGRIFSEQSMKLQELGTAIINYSKLIDNLKKKQEDENITEQERLELSNAMQDALEARSAIMTDLANRNSEMAASVGELINGEREFIEVEKELRELFAEGVKEEARKATTSSKMNITEEDLKAYNDSYTKLIANVGVKGANRKQSISDAFNLLGEDGGEAFFAELERFKDGADSYTTTINNYTKAYSRAHNEISRLKSDLLNAENTVGRASEVSGIKADIREQEKAQAEAQKKIKEWTKKRQTEFGWSTAQGYYDIINTFLNAQNTINAKIKAGVDEWLTTHGITDVTKMTQEQKEAAVKAFDDMIAEYSLKKEAVLDFERQLSNEFGFEWFHVKDPLQPWQESFNNFMLGSTEILDMTTAEIEALEGAYALIEDSNKTQDDMVEALDQKIEECKKIIELSATYTDAMYAAGQTLYTKAEVDKAKEELPIAERARSYFPAKSKKSGGGRSKEDYIDEAARGIKELHKAYKDMQKTFGDGTANEGAWERYGKGVRESLKNAKIDADSFLATVGDLTSEDSVVKAFDELIKRTKDQKKKAELELAKGEFIWEMTIELDNKKFADAMAKAEELIAGYELGVELDKLHIPHDFAQNFFDIGITELPELRLQVMAEYEGLDIGTEEQKKIEETLKRIDEIEAKAQQERLKKYVEFTRDAISERGKILLEGAYTLADINSAFTLTDTLAKNNELISEEQLNVLRNSGKAVSDLLSMDVDKIKELFTVDGKVTISDDQIANLKKYGELLDEQRRLATEHAEEQTKQEISKLDWSLFKESEVFAQVFNDLENASNSLIDTALEKLKEFKDVWADMDVEEFSEVLDLIDKLEAELDLAKPSKALKTAKSGLKDAMNGKGDYKIEFSKNNKAAEDFSPGSSISADDYNAYREALEVELALRENIVNTKANDLAIAEKAYNLTIQNAKATDDEKKAAKEAVDNAKTNLKNAKESRDEVARTLSLDEQRRDALDGIRGRMEKSVDLANDLYDAFKGLAEVFFEEDSIGMVFADMGMQMMNTVMNTIMLQIQLQSATAGAMAFGTALNTAMGVIGWIVMGIQLLTMALTAAFKAHDKSLQNSIDDEMKNLDKLKKSYEELERTLEKAYSADKIGQTTRDMRENLELQKESIREMHELEKDKKKTDDSKLKDYEDQIEEIDEQLKEIFEEAFSSLTNGVFDDIISASRDFVDAWHDAFQETGDGVKGLKETFKDMILDVIRQQASLNVMGKYVDMYKGWMNEYVDPEHGDDILTPDEAAEFADRVAETMPQVNDELEGYLGAMQGVLDSIDYGELSGLEKGIQGITEDQAEVLASYWNSCRFLIASIDTTLADLAANVLGGQDSKNSIVGELKRQTSVLNDIKAMLNSVIASGGQSDHGGLHYIRVFDA